LIIREEQSKKRLSNFILIRLIISPSRLDKVDSGISRISGRSIMSY